MRFGRNIGCNLGDKALFRAGELSSPAPIQESHARPSSPFRDYIRGLNFQLGKDKLPMRLKSALVYKFICAQCASEYVGMTARTLDTRVDETNT